MRPKTGGGKFSNQAGETFTGKPSLVRKWNGVRIPAVAPNKNAWLADWGGTCFTSKIQVSSILTPSTNLKADLFMNPFDPVTKTFMKPSKDQKHRHYKNRSYHRYKDPNRNSDSNYFY